MGGTRLCLPRIYSFLSFSIIFSSPLLPLCTVSSACGTHCEDNAGSVDGDILDSEGDRRVRQTRQGDLRAGSVLRVDNSLFGLGMMNHSP